jgi:riboflavin-specific deaminase-like protein
MSIADLEDFGAEAARHLRAHGRPLVTLSYAQTIDGSITLVRGRPTALSGPEATRITHELRAAHDAILVGIGTVLSDDPLLTVRHASGPSPQPVVLDGSLRFPPGARLLRDNPKRAWIVTAEASPERRRALEERGAAIIGVPRALSGRLDLSAVLAELGERGVASLMVEGGAGVITSFLRERLVDRVAVTIVPIFAGGCRAVGEMGCESLQGLDRLTQTRVVAAGADYVLFGRVWRHGATTRPP